MRLRVSDVAASAFLAERYHTQAETCLQMARVTVSPVKDGWLQLAAEWTKLARETDARAALEGNNCWTNKRLPLGQARESGHDPSK
jgi:hypothetical protein